MNPIPFCSPCCSACPSLHDDFTLHDDYGNIGYGSADEIRQIINRVRTGRMNEILSRSDVHPERPVILHYGGSGLHFSDAELADFLSAALDGRLHSVLAA